MTNELAIWGINPNVYNGGGEAPLRGFFFFLYGLDDKTSAPDVISSFRLSLERVLSVAMFRGYDEYTISLPVSDFGWAQTAFLALFFSFEKTG